VKHLRFFYQILNGIECRKFTTFKLLPDRYVQIEDNDPIPMEDLEYILSDVDLTEEQAYQQWLSYLP
jgi:hypothetical protein